MNLKNIMDAQTRQYFDHLKSQLSIKKYIREYLMDQWVCEQFVPLRHKKEESDDTTEKV